MSRIPEDISSLSKEEKLAKQPYVVGDTSGNYIFNGKAWEINNEQTKAKLQPEIEAATAAATTPVNTASDAIANTVGSLATLGAAAASKDNGDSAFAAAEREKARLNREDVQSRAQQDAQQAYQIGSRDYRVEGDKDAAARAQAQFTQRMQQQSAASGGGAAVLASLNVQDPTADYAAHRQRSDEQRLLGSDFQTAAESAALAGIQAEQTADEVNRTEAEDAKWNNQQRRLSEGDSGGNSSETADETNETKEENVNPSNIASSAGTSVKKKQSEETTPAQEKVLSNIKALQDYVNEVSGSTVRHGASAEDVNVIKDLVDSGTMTLEDIKQRLGDEREKATGSRNLDKQSNASYIDKEGTNEVTFSSNSQAAEDVMASKNPPSDVRLKNLVSAIYRRF